MAKNSLGRQVKIEMDEITEQHANAAWLDRMKKLPELHQVVIGNNERV